MWFYTTPSFRLAVPSYLPMDPNGYGAHSFHYTYIKRGTQQSVRRLYLQTQVSVDFILEVGWFWCRMHVVTRITKMWCTGKFSFRLISKTSHKFYLASQGSSRWIQINWLAGLKFVAIVWLIISVHFKNRPRRYRVIQYHVWP